MLSLPSGLRAGAGRSTTSTMAVPSSSNSSVACSRRAAVSPTCEAITMLAKLITLPMASAMPSASSQPPVLRIEARVSRTTNDREECDDRELAQRQ